jgi:hypothetical protein
MCSSFGCQWTGSRVPGVDLAQVELGLGNRDAAVKELEEAYRSRAVRTVIIGDPFFSELAPDERYCRLLGLLRLPLQPSAPM